MTGIIVGAGIGVVCLIYAIYAHRKSYKIKSLLYETTSTISLARAYSPADDYKLSILYQSKSNPKELISSVYTRFLKFANLGKEPIRSTDIAAANPIRIMISGVRTLDIALETTTRSASNICLKEVNLSKDDSSALISFDYLDYKDGGLVRILTEGSQGDVKLIGDVIGMPTGIRTKDSKRYENLQIALGIFLGVLALVGSQVLSAFYYYNEMGTWHNVWLLWSEPLKLDTLG